MLLKEMEQEAQTTRKMLGRIPDDHKETGYPYCRIARLG